MPLQFPDAYIVSMDFNTPEGDYTRLQAELNRSVEWWRYLKNTWIVVRFEALVELGPLLRSLIYPNDRF